MATKKNQTLTTKQLINYAVIIVIIISSVIGYFTVEDKDNKGSKTNNEAKFAKPENTDTTQLIVMFYNLENLFDTENDPKNRYDDDYTPEGSKEWTEQRFETKVENLAKVISNVSDDELPDLVGVCEIENRKVLEDLISQKPLEGQYKIIHEESKDVRGIDLGLLYKPAEFKPIDHKKIDIYYKEGRPARTREILFVKGLTLNNDTLYIFLNHWKSRLSRKDDNNAEYKRIAAAKSLRKAVDKVLKQNPEAKIIIMGDFNDEPTNKSIYSTLKAKDREHLKSKKYLFNTMYAADHDKQGTYFHDHHWIMFDNMIVSQAFLDSNSDIRLEGEGHVLKKDFMLETNRNGEQYPKRTYKHGEYQPGYSDHLPIYIILKVFYN